ncbi:MAG: hypothetical protein ABS808_01320 [Wolbachia endosymbiont of Polyergus mexicanus]|uniref:Uncharacterized protein n=1 Tax=Wolbachia endosymbiont of Polyergus mexicanus TaxID=3171167 RepID=A0AAU7YI58_9RICK
MVEIKSSGSTAVRTLQLAGNLHNRRCHSSMESRKKEAGSQCLGTGMTKK